jgi:hypothetical protein
VGPRAKYVNCSSRLRDSPREQYRFTWKSGQNTD